MEILNAECWVNNSNQYNKSTFSMLELGHGPVTSPVSTKFYVGYSCTIWTFSQAFWQLTNIIIIMSNSHKDKGETERLV